MKLKLVATFIISTLFLSCNKDKEVKPIIQNIKELVFASGSLEWENSYKLTAQTDGVLSNVDFEIGNTVKKGTILANIDNPTNLVNTETSKEQLTISLENLSSKAPALQQVQQSINFAEAKYKQDKVQAERYERLYKSQSVAKSEFENYTLAAQNSLTNLNVLKKSYAQLQQQAKQSYITTKGQLKTNEVAQHYNDLVVPQNGTIIEKLKSNGDFVKKGEVIATIADVKTSAVDLVPLFEHLWENRSKSRRLHNATGRRQVVRVLANLLATQLAALPSVRLDSEQARVSAYVLAEALVGSIVAWQSGEIDCGPSEFAHHLHGIARAVATAVGRSAPD